MVVSVTDAEDGNLDHVIEWSSNIDGLLSYGGQFDVMFSSLSIGVQIVTASIIDSNYQTDSASFTFTLGFASENQKPVVTLLAPAANDEFESGGSFTADYTFSLYGVSNPDPIGSPIYDDLPLETQYSTVFEVSGLGQTIMGSSGSDFIDAGAGDDVLIGNLGNVYLLGGQGNDIYQFSSGDGHDTINNYSNIGSIKF